MDIDVKQVKYNYGKFHIPTQSEDSGGVIQMEGCESTGVNSTALGNDTQAIGDYSQSQGTGTTAVGDNSSASGAGQEILVSATASLSGGSQFCTFSSKVTMNEGDALKFIVNEEVKYRKVLAVSSNASNTFVTLDDAISSQDVSGITVYKVYGIALGVNSHVEGNKNIAYGDASHAEGVSTVAASDAAHAEGWNTRALALRSHTEGSGTLAKSKDAHAEGDGTQALGSESHAEGKNTVAGSNCCHAEGEGTITWGSRSHAEGFGTLVNKAWTVSCNANAVTYTTSDAHDLQVGQVVKVTSNNSSQDYVAVTSIGSATTFTGEQPRTTAISNAAAAVVLGCTHGADAHSEGTRCTASNTGAHAEGDTTIAGASGSHAEGKYTHAINTAEHAEGQYNVSNKATTTFGNKGNTIHSVGIGDSSARKNAFEIMQNGDIYVLGIGSYNGTNAGANGVKTLQEVLRDLGAT